MVGLRGRGGGVGEVREGISKRALSSLVRKSRRVTSGDGGIWEVVAGVVVGLAR
jgi:hypothetical protein